MVNNICSHCGASAGPGEAFCSDCGAALAGSAPSPQSAAITDSFFLSTTCSTCGALVATGEAFCSDCGATLAAQPTGGEPLAATKSHKRRAIAWAGVALLLAGVTAAIAGVALHWQGPSFLSKQPSPQSSQNSTPALPAEVPQSPVETRATPATQPAEPSRPPRVETPSSSAAQQQDLPCSVERTFDQPESRDPSGTRVLVEASTIRIVDCDGEELWVYEYDRRPGSGPQFRVIRPPDFAHAIGGRDFSSYGEALAAASNNTSFEEKPKQ
jgi:hypothetical protein